MEIRVESARKKRDRTKREIKREIEESKTTMNNTEHNITEEVTTETTAPRPNVFGRKRTKALFAVALLLGAVLASGVTRSGKGQMEMGTVASADINSPAPQAKVFKQAMPMYHLSLIHI